MPSPVLDTFRDTKYAILAISILIAYGAMLLFLDQFLFFAPYFTFYVPFNGAGDLALDAVLAALTSLVLTISIRQMLLQRAGGVVSKTGVLGVIAAVVAGGCPCYYLIPLLAIAGAVGGTLGAVGILLTGFQTPIKVAATLLLIFAIYRLNKFGVCKTRTASQGVKQNQPCSR